LTYSVSRKYPPGMIQMIVRKQYEIARISTLSCTKGGRLQGVANGTSKNVGLRKFWLDLEISEAFLISLEVSFFHGLCLLF